MKIEKIKAKLEKAEKGTFQYDSLKEKLDRAMGVVAEVAEEEAVEEPVAEEKPKKKSSKKKSSKKKVDDEGDEGDSKD